VTSLRHLEGWKLASACSRHGEPELWFSEDPAGIAAAKAVCGGCPVRAVCLADALARGEGWGVLGGLTPPERRALAAAGGLRRPSVHGAAQHGTRGSYNAGCRCPACTRANTAYVHGWRAERATCRVTPGGIVAVVHVLAQPTGHGRHRAWPGQLFLNLETAA
jgi:hypothetical protein